MTVAASFGEWVKRRRLTLGKTRDDLAECAGCSRDTIEKIEVGLRRPSRQIAELLSGCLRIPGSAHELFVGFARGLIDVESATRVLWTALYGHASHLPTPL